MGLLNPGDPIAQFTRNRCSISPIDIDISHFYDVVPGNIITVRYIDFNYGLGSFAKEAVEIRDENEVFLSLDASERDFQKARTAVWITYVSVLVLWTGAVFLYYSDERAQRKLTAHRQQTKAKRREWLDAHPEEKGAPPQRQTQKEPRSRIISCAVLQIAERKYYDTI